MIQLPIDIRPEYKDKVKKFCSKNNLEWGTVNSECLLEGVHGTPIDVEKLLKYIKNLEQKRKNFRAKKSFLWKIFN